MNPEIINFLKENIIAIIAILVSGIISAAAYRISRRNRLDDIYEKLQGLIVDQNELKEKVENLIIKHTKLKEKFALIKTIHTVNTKFNTEEKYNDEFLEIYNKGESFLVSSLNKLQGIEGNIDKKELFIKIRDTKILKQTLEKGELTYRELIENYNSRLIKIHQTALLDHIIKLENQ